MTQKNTGLKWPKFLQEREQAENWDFPDKLLHSSFFLLEGWEHCLAPPALASSHLHFCSNTEEQHIPLCTLGLSPIFAVLIRYPTCIRNNCLPCGEQGSIFAQFVIVYSLQSLFCQAVQSPSQLFHPISVGIREDCCTQALITTYKVSNSCKALSVFLSHCWIITMG